MPTYISRSSSAQLESERSEKSIKATDHQLGFVLDESHSMHRVADEAVTAFNTLVDEQRATDQGSALLSLALFNNTITLLYDGLPIAEVEPLTVAQYNPSGGTALNDAIGSMIQTIGKRAKRSTRVLIAIVTDGEENSSRAFSEADILSMITYRRITHDWQFIFIGPKEAEAYALSIGIPKSNMVVFSADAAGIKTVMVRLSASIKAYQLGDRRYALKLRNRG